MIKYCETSIVFREFPDEITLAINLSNCPHRCPGCHSPHLQQDTGEELTDERLCELLEYYKGRITCVGFMGGDGDLDRLLEIFKVVRKNFPDLKIGWYSGGERIPFSTEYLDYAKLGPYVEDLGPLDSPTTNQRLYKKVGDHWEKLHMCK